jgi:hypothetical protein
MASRVKHHLLTHSILCSFVANPAANCESMRNQPFPQLLHTMTDKTWWCWRRVARAFCRIAAPLTSLHSKTNLRLCLRDVVCLVLVLNSNSSFGLRHTFYCRCLLSLSPFSWMRHDVDWFHDRILRPSRILSLSSSAPSASFSTSSYFKHH